MLFMRSSMPVRMLLLVLVTMSSSALAGNVDLPRYPSLSPDGQQMVFSWRGDLWKVNTTGGWAVRLTSHRGDDLRSAWSPDGESIAFSSDRSGYLNIHTMDVNGANVQHIAKNDRSMSLTGFGVDEDGQPVILFDGGLEGDVYRGARPYMISVDGGEIRRVHDAFGEHPVVSPNGRYVAFTRGGSSWTRRHYRGPDDRNVWLYDRNNDSFRQLTTWEGNDGQAQWLGNSTLLFLSDRDDDAVNLYRMPIDRGGQAAERMSDFGDRDIWSFAVSADGSTAVMHVWDTIHRLDLSNPNAQPQVVDISAGEDESDNYELKSMNREVSEAAISPDGKVMAYVAYGEVYVRLMEDDAPTRRVTNDHAVEKDIAWSPDGLKLYFTSDRDGMDSIFAATVAMTREELKESFEETLNPPDEEPAEDETDADAAEQDAADNGENKADDANGDDAADDDNGDESEDDAEEEEEEEEEEIDPAFEPKRWHDALRFAIEPVIQTEHNDRNASPSPDGQSLAFRRSRGDLLIHNFETGENLTLVTGWDSRMSWRWSPDSKLIAYDKSDMDFNSDVWIVPADGSEDPVNITRHPDNDGNPRWSADGKILSFVSERINEEYDVWMVYLDKDLEALTERELNDYYEEAAKQAKKRKPLKVDIPKDEEDAADDADEDEEDEQEEAVKDEAGDEDELELDDAYLRLRRVTTLSGNEFNNEITPGGDRIIFSGNVGDSGGLYSVKWDGSERKTLHNGGSVAGLSLTGDKVVIVSGGRAGTVSPTGGDMDWHDIRDEIRIDLQKQSSQKFLEAARILGENFYHPTMKDLDWDDLAQEYHELALHTRTASEFNFVAAHFLGELNGSHLGIFARGEDSPNAQPYGRLGIETERIEDGYRVTTVFENGPSAVGDMALKIGDVITAVQFEPIDENDTLVTMLQGRIGEETVITVQRTLDEGNGPVELNLLITPTSYGGHRQLKYEHFERENARLVSEWSDGRIGYIHIQSMSQPALDEFERNLYAAAHDKDGLIIDVRNNGGGWTTDRLLASIMTREHAYTIPRGAERKTGHYPQDRLFIQRYLLPINMLCNEKSFSNAEIISHAFKTLDRGNLVGQQTYGGVISTGGTRLIDGTFVRLPFRGWYLPDGTDMENNGAIPDIIVDQTPQAESADDDEQLRAAVEDLMARLE